MASCPGRAAVSTATGRCAACREFLAVCALVIEARSSRARTRQEDSTMTDTTMNTAAAKRGVSIESDVKADGITTVNRASAGLRVKSAVKAGLNFAKIEYKN
jgi:hypothetical protein